MLASGPAAEVLTRLDLPLAHGDAAQAALEVTVVAHDAADRIARPGLRRRRAAAASAAATPGVRAVVRVLARDVSLTLARHADTSILNILPATVLEIADDALARRSFASPRAAGRGAARARVAALGARALNLHPGLQIQAQIKAAALSA